MASSGVVHSGSSPSFGAVVLFWTAVFFGMGVLMFLLQVVKVPERSATFAALVAGAAASAWRARWLERRHGPVKASVWLLRMLFLYAFVLGITNGVLLGIVSDEASISVGGILGAVAVGFFYVGRRRALMHVRERQLAVQNAMRRAKEKEDQVRAESPWMHDPDDYSALPMAPDLRTLPEDVSSEYARKHLLRVEAAKLVDRQITEEKILHGTEYTRAQREVLIQRECRQAQSIKEQVEFEVGQEQRERRRVQRENQDTVDAIENSTQFGRSRRFKQDHPFLSGLMGNEKVDQLTSQGWWKG